MKKMKKKMYKDCLILMRGIGDGDDFCRNSAQTNTFT